MLCESRIDRLERLVGRPREQVKSPERRARANVVLVDVDRSLVELCGLARVAELLIDHAVLVARLAVGRGYLQGVAEFHAGLVEVARREELVPLLQMPRLARFRAAAARQDERAETEGQPESIIDDDTRHRR